MQIGYTMKKSLLLLAVFSLLFLFCRNNAYKEDVIYSFRGIGPGHIGMPMEEFVKQFGEPLKRSETKLVKSLEYSDECLQINADIESEKIISFIFYDKNGKSFSGQTDKGIRLGMPKRQVIKAYGKDYIDNTGELPKNSDYSSIFYDRNEILMEFQFTSESGLGTIIIESKEWKKLKGFL